MPSSREPESPVICARRPQRSLENSALLAGDLRLVKTFVAEKECRRITLALVLIDKVGVIPT